ncbi:TPA: hypothetical protein I7241_03430 [Vibrio vulnificus]|nr:hypothetical protein [Vibrio vulnificus]
MSEIKQALTELGACTLEYVEQNSDTLHRFCDAQNALFMRVRENKPETSVALLLLGVLTKAHIEALAQFTTSKESRHSMRDVFDKSVGEAFSDKFHDVDLHDLLMVSTLWAFVQGRLNMDFSLANDHAAESAMQLAPFLGTTPDVVRTELMHAFYQGKTLFQRHDAKPTLWQRIVNALFP